MLFLALLTYFSPCFPIRFLLVSNFLRIKDAALNYGRDNLINRILMKGNATKSDFVSTSRPPINRVKYLFSYD